MRNSDSRTQSIDPKGQQYEGSESVDGSGHRRNMRKICPGRRIQRSEPGEQTLHSLHRRGSTRHCPNHRMAMVVVAANQAARVEAKLVAAAVATEVPRMGWHHP